ncbi:hypothetical protein C8R44DRAFT_732114 [Mycena epipterygia]|nr:hypothetical protein C8R44DRAFT_732114 [Mycena epipterygia]
MPNYAHNKNSCQDVHLEAQASAQARLPLPPHPLPPPLPTPLPPYNLNPTPKALLMLAPTWAENPPSMLCVNRPRTNTSLLRLAHNSDLASAILSVSHMENKFNKHFSCLWVLPNEEPFTDQFQWDMTSLARDAVSVGLVSKEHWFQTVTRTERARGGNKMIISLSAPNPNPSHPKARCRICLRHGEVGISGSHSYEDSVTPGKEDNFCAKLELGEQSPGITTFAGYSIPVYAVPGACTGPPNSSSNTPYSNRSDNTWIILRLGYRVDKNELST